MPVRVVTRRRFVRAGLETRRRASGTRLAFSTRTGGISAAPYATLNLGASTADRPEAVAENRRRLLQSLDLDFNRLVTAGQVHGAAVAVVSEPGLARGHDGLVTRVPGLPLAVSSADCLPILFTAPGAIAAAHAGWRGTVAGIAEATLERAVPLGKRRSRPGARSSGSLHS